MSAMLALNGSPEQLNKNTALYMDDKIEA